VLEYFQKYFYSILTHITVYVRVTRLLTPTL